MRENENMRNPEWTKLPRSERARVGRYELDVWRVGGGARYTVLNTESSEYVAGGETSFLTDAKTRAVAFAQEEESYRAALWIGLSFGDS